MPNVSFQPFENKILNFYKIFQKTLDKIFKRYYLDSRKLKTTKFND